MTWERLKKNNNPSLGFEIYRIWPRWETRPLTPALREEMIHLDLMFCLLKNFLFSFNSCHKRIMNVVLLTVAVLFLQCQTSEFNPVPWSVFLSSVPKLSFVLCLLWHATCGWHVAVVGALRSWALFWIVELHLNLLCKASTVFYFH